MIKITIAIFSKDPGNNPDRISDVWEGFKYVISLNYLKKKVWSVDKKDILFNLIPI